MTDAGNGKKTPVAQSWSGRQQRVNSTRVGNESQGKDDEKKVKESQKAHR
ncbi:MAG: hypothetical protein LBL90_12895 [Prevotellaceae bacterium]|nr:hypothetical protein [Prevotellaceae bacterium]